MTTQQGLRMEDSRSPLAVDGPAEALGVRALPAPLVGPSAIAIVGMALLGYTVLNTQGLRHGVLLGIGVALGIALYHARFGFTSAFRRLVAVGNGEALRAHTLMLAAACILFAPILAGATGLFGTRPEPSVAPIGVGMLFGAFLFGIGMQLGGACASGTLYTVGSGHTVVVLTLSGFVIGSTLGAWHWAFWAENLALLPPVSFADSRLGIGGALAVQLTALALIAGATIVIGKRKNPPPAERPPAAAGFARVVRGSWPLWVGAIVLALLNALTLLIKGSPWGITSAFALWGSRLLAGAGIDVASWTYWSGENAASLEAPLLADTTTVMNLGIILGALLAAAVGGTFVLHRRIPLKTALAALVGGILMGYGARLAFGCNIGAYFGGIASFSLHGWAWGVMAILGTYAGLKARPVFGLLNPKPTDSVC